MARAAWDVNPLFDENSQDSVRRASGVAIPARKGSSSPPQPCRRQPRPARDSRAHIGPHHQYPTDDVSRDEFAPTASQGPQGFTHATALVTGSDADARDARPNRVTHRQDRPLDVRISPLMRTWPTGPLDPGRKELSPWNRASRGRRGSRYILRMRVLAPCRRAPRRPTYNPIRPGS